MTTINIIKDSKFIFVFGKVVSYPGDSSGCYIDETHSTLLQNNVSTHELILQDNKAPVSALKFFDNF